jgi:class 3 adenylate cyclase
VWLIGVLVPAWAVVFGLHVRTVITTGAPRIPVVASYAPANGYPTAVADIEASARDLPVAPGDRLLRAGTVDLRGVGHLGFEAIARAESASGRLPLVIERDGQERAVLLALERPPVPWWRIPFQLAYAGVGLLILLRAPGKRLARLTFIALYAWAIHRAPFEGSLALCYASELVYEVLGGPTIAVILYWAIHFPDEMPSRMRVPRGLAFAIAIAWPLSRLSRFIGGPLSMEASQVARAIVDITFILALVGILTRNYRAADPVGRRRVKCVVVGMYIGTLPVVLPLALSALVPNPPAFDLILGVTGTLLVAVPLGLLVGIARYNLFDIDRVISATASYSALGMLGGVLVLWALPRIASAGSGALGVDPETMQLYVGALAFVVAVPVHRRLRPRLERAFFPERHRLEDGFGELIAALAAARGAKELARTMGARLEELLRPEICAAFARAEESAPYAPLFVHGAGVPPLLPADTPVVTALRHTPQPLVLDDRRAAAFGPCGTELANMGAVVLVPVPRGDTLPAFLFLGAKRSGDVYTTTELALLTAVASAASARLVTFDDDALIREMAAMQEALRQYVPGAVAEHVLSGRERIASEREVTVFFVDIRGYTSLSRGRRAEEVFSLISRYTQAVSEIIAAHGGCVVEYSGDGLMAVFGAPQPLPRKEAAAVAAARAVCEAVPGLRVAAAGERAAPLSVGVGIATGPAFVGDIQAADRLVWSVIGSTTNLAARLESLTRDFDAAIVIDGVTRARATTETRDFMAQHETAIKGYDETQTVYALRREAEILSQNAA